MHVTLKFAALVLLVAGTATCSDPDPLPSDSGNPATSTATSILITDTPFPYDLVEGADLYIVRVTVGTDSGSTGSGCGGAVQVAAPNRTIDLLALQHGTTALLDTFKLTAGDYRAVCVTINTNLSSLTLRDGRILTGTSSPGIDWSGSGERILKADVHDPIAIADSGGRILIHFDVGRSFIPLQDVEPPRSDSGFAFIATLEAFDPSRTGSITGRLVSPFAGAPIVNASIRALVGDSSMAEGTWFVAGTGTTDADGNFKLAYLSPSSRWAGPGWVYNLAADAPAIMGGLAPLRVKGVDVTIGHSTDLGVLVMPEPAAP